MIFIQNFFKLFDKLAVWWLQLRIDKKVNDGQERLKKLHALVDQALLEAAKEKDGFRLARGNWNLQCETTEIAIQEDKTILYRAYISQADPDDDVLISFVLGYLIENGFNDERLHIVCRNGEGEILP